MSESSKKKSNPLLKFVIIYTIIMAIITGVLIYLYYEYNVNIDLSKYFLEQEVTNTIEVEQVEEKGNNYSNIKKSKLTDKYYLNNIVIEEKKLNYGNIIDYDSYSGEEIYKISVNYTQINGLKDKEIESKINSLIEERVKQLVSDEEIYNKNIENVLISMYMEPGSSDLISGNIMKSIFYKTKQENGDDYKIEYYPGINIRLDTGEELKLEDLFTKDASIKTILSKCAYKQLAFEYALDYETGVGDLENIDYGKIENEVIKVINDFNSQKEKNFWFMQKYIYIVVNNEIFTITNADFSEYININNIVKPQESLYELGNKPRENYIFGDQYISSFEYYDEISNDSYLSIFNYYKVNGMVNEGDEYGEEYTRVLNKSITKIIDTIKSDTKREKGKGYAYNINMYYSEYLDEDSNDIGPVFEGEKVEVDKNNFKENVESLYALTCRQRPNGEFFFSLTNLMELNEYKIYKIILTDLDKDGKFELGQKLYPSNWNDFEEYSTRKYEY